MAHFTTDQLAGAMYGYVETMMIYSPDTDVYAEVKKINDGDGDGFVIEESIDRNIRGNVMRYEGVRVSEDRLKAAYDLAYSWMTAK